LLVLATTLAAVQAAIESPPMRHRRALRAARKSRHDRREKRVIRLERANAPSGELETLDLLVEQAADFDETVTSDAEPLLDRYVDVAIAKRQCAAALAQGQPSHLEVQLAIARECHPNGAQVIERRIALGHVLAARVRALDESLGELDEMIRYYVERASIPD